MRLFLSLFFAFFLSVILSILFGSSVESFIFAIIFFGIIWFYFGKKEAAISSGALVVCIYLSGISEYFKSVEVQLAMLFLALFFISKDIQNIFWKHIRGVGNLFFSILYGVGLYLFVILLMIAISLVFWIAGIGIDSAKVYDKVVELPFYVILVAVFLAHIAEELLFRGFLAKRFGILVSATLFSLVHFGYGSVFELLGTFIVGLVFAWYFLRERNLVPCMVAHSLFNITSISMIYALEFLQKGGI